MLDAELVELGDKSLDSAFTVNNVVSGTNVDDLLVKLLLTNNDDEVVLGELGLANLFGEGRIRIVNVDIESSIVDFLLDLLGVRSELVGDSDNDGLARRDPEWPLSTSVLDEDGHESLH